LGPGSHATEAEWVSVIASASSKEDVAVVIYFLSKNLALMVNNNSKNKLAETDSFGQERANKKAGMN
jgi:hypothetical protein